MNYDYIVIGAGASGLSFAALMEKRGYCVALLEAHSLPGGCSSYFERNGNVFDAGATTLSGLKPGRSLDLLIKELHLELDLREINPGLISSINGKEVRRYKDPIKWIKELETAFPNINHKKFWSIIENLDSDGWNISSKLKNIPLRSLKDISGFSFKNLINGITLIPYLLKSVASFLPTQSKEYKSFINELLFITAQNKMEDTPMLMGAMGLNYPADTSYAIGGMKAFSEALAKKCSHKFYRHEVISITSMNEGFKIETSKGDFFGSKVVSTLPFWNHESLFKDTETKRFFQNPNYEKTKEECWSAFMMYLTVPHDLNRESLYYQIHCNSIPHCFTESFFVSISHPDDKTRTRPGRQTITISTHTRPLQWLNLSKEEYRRKKEETSNYILKAFCGYFKITENDIEDLLSGSPGTFIKYTRRKDGLVGGIPHSLKRNPVRLIQSLSPVKNFYLIGDTQFPGQGINAVIMGAQNLVHQLHKTED
jgi:C-3',4' desaturase CrtD